MSSIIGCSNSKHWPLVYHDLRQKPKSIVKTGVSNNVQIRSNMQHLHGSCDELIVFDEPKDFEEDV